MPVEKVMNLARNGQLFLRMPEQELGAAPNEYDKDVFKKRRIQIFSQPAGSSIADLPIDLLSVETPLNKRCITYSDNVWGMLQIVRAQAPNSK